MAPIKFSVAGISQILTSNIMLFWTEILKKRENKIVCSDKTTLFIIKSANLFKT